MLLFVQLPGQVAGLLGDPDGRRARGAAGHEHASGLELAEEQHEQRLQAERLDRQAITGEHARGMARRNARQDTPARCGTGGTPCRRSRDRTAVAEPQCPS